VSLRRSSEGFELVAGIVLLDQVHCCTVEQLIEPAKGGR
jgi:hypothetical protein